MIDLIQHPWLLFWLIVCVLAAVSLIPRVLR